MEPSKWVEISLPLSKISLGSGILRLDLEASSTWVPDEVLGNGDRRELGVAVERIWVGEG